MKIDYKALLAICAKEGVSITDTAAKAGIGRTTMYNIKTGHNVQVVTAGKLAKALNVPVEKLLAD